MRCDDQRFSIKFYKEVWEKFNFQIAGIRKTPRQIFRVADRRAAAAAATGRRIGIRIGRVLQVNRAEATCFAVRLAMRRIDWAVVRR